MPEKDNKDMLPPHLRNAPSKFDYLKQEYLPDPSVDADGYKHLGDIVGWNGIPPKEYTDCRSAVPAHALGKDPKSYSIHRGIYDYCCDICKIKWTETSTD